MFDGERGFLAHMESQYGIGSRAQALASGLSEAQIDSRVASGRLERVYPGA